jgi:beta-aspartyl-peptidase (threonine type)
MPGCGFYADNRRGAVSTSGEGEAIARVMLAGEFLRVLQAGAPKQAMTNALDAVSRIPGGEAGIIAITPQGDLLWDHNSANFAVGLATDQDGTPRAYTQKSQE